MATIADVSDSLLDAWIRYELTSPMPTTSDIRELLKLSTAAKQARIKTYLQSRVASKTASVSSADSDNNARKAALNADITAISILIGGL